MRLKLFLWLVALFITGCGVLGEVGGQPASEEGVVIRSWTTGYPTETAKRIYFRQTSDSIRIGVSQTADHRLDSVYFRSGGRAVSVPKDYTSCIRFPDMNSLSFMTDNVTDILGSSTNSKLQLSIYAEGLETDTLSTLSLEYLFRGKEFSGLSINGSDIKKTFSSAHSGEQVCSWLQGNFPALRKWGGDRGVCGYCE